MRRVIYVVAALAVLFGLFAVSGTPARAATVTTPQVQTLYAGQNTPVGTVSVWNDANTLFVKFQTISGCDFVETSLAVDTSAVGNPQTDKDNPIPGQFGRSTVHDPPVAAYTYSMPIPSVWRYPSMDLKIAAHAAVRLLDDDHQVLDIEDARTNGTQFAEANRASHFIYSRDLSAAEACALIRSDRDVSIIDVCASGAFNSGHLPEATNIPLGNSPYTAFVDEVSQLKRNQTYLVYCGSGTNGGRAAAAMKGLGFTNVYNLAGGYGAWTAAGVCPAP